MVFPILQCMPWFWSIGSHIFCLHTGTHRLTEQMWKPQVSNVIHAPVQQLWGVCWRQRGQEIPERIGMVVNNSEKVFLRVIIPERERVGFGGLNQTNSSEKLHIFPLRLQQMKNKNHLLSKVVWSIRDTISEALGLLPALCIRSQFPYSQRKLSTGWTRESPIYSYCCLFKAGLAEQEWGTHTCNDWQPPKNSSNSKWAPLFNLFTCGTLLMHIKVTEREVAWKMYFLVAFSSPLS